MNAIATLHPQFVTNTDGQQTAVLLPITEYNDLLKDLGDLAAAGRVNEPQSPICNW